MNYKDRLLHFFATENSRNWPEYARFLAEDIKWYLYQNEEKEIIAGREPYISRIKAAYEGNNDSFSCEVMYDGGGARVTAILVDSRGRRVANFFEFNEDGLIQKEWEFVL